MTPPAPPAPTALALMTLLPAFSQWSSFLLIHIDIIQYTYIKLVCGSNRY